MNESLKSRRAFFQMAVAGSAGGVALASPGQPWNPAREKVADDPVRTGNLLFLSGIGGWSPARRPEGPGDIRQQTRAVLEVMKSRLEESGTSMENVLKVQVALVDPEVNWAPMNEVYISYFSDPRPVRSYFGCTGFRRPGQLLQVDCIAYVE